MKRYVISGGSGFIGEALTRSLQSDGHDVAVLSRDPSRVRAGRGVAWNPPEPGAWKDEVAAADVVVNLAGANIGGGRWTESRKHELVSSRIDATSALTTVISELSSPPALLSASAVGLYGADRGEEILIESSSAGSGFLADLTRRWEETARRAEGKTRLVLMRFGVVLGPDGGALEKMLPPFRMGLGGRLGDGRQWMSWVTREDVIRFIRWAGDRDEVSGVYNVTSPSPVTNREFTAALAQALRRPAIFPVPGFALRTMFGEMADEVLLGGQRVVPERTKAEGFRFEDREILPALQSVV